jgi:beta-alanine degradation protein BauB
MLGHGTTRFVSTPRERRAAGTACRVALVATLAAVGACATRPSLPDPLAAGWNGAPVCERLHEDAEQRILRCSFAPSVGHERHFHDRHFGYAIAGGRMRITDASGTRDVDVATGSRFTSAGVAWHEVLNVGDSTVVCLIVEPK